MINNNNTWTGFLHIIKNTKKYGRCGIIKENDRLINHNNKKTLPP